MSSRSKELSSASGKTLATMLAAVAADSHFWVPTLVLIAGLLLLRWIS